ncbi:MAG: hypothetical protein Q7T89_00400 [Anaerolineales bacterium]|nr:hypothetical protein [Anaerolineales bacterium]
MNPISSRIFWQTFIGSSILLSIFAIHQTVQQISALDIILWRSKWILLVGVFALNILAGAFGLRQLSLEGSVHWIEKLEFNPTGIFGKWFGFILVVSGFALTWVVRLFLYGNILPQVTPIFWVFLWASLVQSLGLKLITRHKWHTLFALTILVQGLIYQIYGHLAIVSNYPFSIGYSEASRHYYASLFFAKSLYASQMPLPYLHPTRYFLMSLPFLFEGLPLWFHRLWQALLWIGLTATSSILLARRLALRGWMQFLVAAWVFLYFFQGAVYYHLHVCVIIILAGVSTRHLWRSLLFVIMASIWAGASRVNWFPVPAMLAIAIYLLETSYKGKGWRYWLTPFIWGISGFVAAIVSQFIYINVSGNADIRTFGSSFTSTLIWTRLLPNDTFPLGILLGIMIVSAPLIIAMIQMTRGKFSRFHPLRWLALFAMLFVLFLGGLIVSVKIGGGADLHNMDAFLVLLALIATSFFAGQVAGEDDLNPAWGQIHWSVTAAALLVPLGFALPQIGFLPRYDPIMVEKDIQKLQAAVSDVAANGGGEILFVTERQLLTFEELNNIPLVPEYEQVELMEMAMSGNREYLEKYYADLKNQRFAIIIAEKQKFTQQKKGSFIEENKAWVRYVGAPLLCAYKPVESLSSTNAQIFVPRPTQPSCKDPFSE